jgi:hypothetical protein
VLTSIYDFGSDHVALELKDRMRTSGLIRSSGAATRDPDPRPCPRARRSRLGFSFVGCYVSANNARMKRKPIAIINHNHVLIRLLPSPRRMEFSEATGDL